MMFSARCVHKIWRLLFDRTLTMVLKLRDRLPIELRVPRRLFALGAVTADHDPLTEWCLSKGCLQSQAVPALCLASLPELSLLRRQRNLFPLRPVEARSCT